MGSGLRFALFPSIQMQEASRSTCSHLIRKSAPFSQSDMVGNHEQQLQFFGKHREQFPIVFRFEESLPRLAFRKLRQVWHAANQWRILLITNLECADVRIYVGCGEPISLDIAECWIEDGLHFEGSDVGVRHSALERRDLGTTTREDYRGAGIRM